MNIFLIGPMGSGKSTIGRQLATELGMEFVDSDKEIETRAGADIPWIFDVEGEEGFRRRESAAIADLAERQGIVLATGGGAILREENRNVLRAKGFVIYLHASVDQQLERTAKDRNRPLLQTDNPRQVLTDLMAVRDPLYLSCCDHRVLTDRRRPKAVTREIVQTLRSREMMD